MTRPRHRHGPPWLLTGLGLFLLAAAAAEAAPNFRLKPGALSKVCVECHEEFKEVLGRRVLHTPVAKGECAGCHNPHTSKHEKLLSAGPGEICQDCHDDLVPAAPVSAHAPFEEQKCDRCHDPHGSSHEMVLVRSGSRLCFECHEDLGKKIEANRFPHEPVTESCLECHAPHTSAASPRLLIAADPTLCLECHKTGAPGFRQKHENYPVQKGRCSSCHDPHGSDTAAILYDNVHDPVVEKKCNECHGRSTSSEPFALKDRGFEICEGCHYDTINEAFNNANMHWPLLDEKGCINCHAPHASS